MPSTPIFQNGNIVIKQCKQGYFAFNRFDDTIGQCLDLYGEWCDEELDFFDELLSPGDTILDVGAYIGTHTVFFAQKVGSLGRVLAFEPQRSSFQLLCTNLSLNALYNVQTLQVGVSHVTSHTLLPVTDPYIGGNYGALKIEGHAQGQQLPLITLDSLQLEQCDHIKIDVEGMEAKVLQGARQLIQTLRPTLYVENNTTNHSRAILELLHELKYDCWWHLIPYFNPHNFFGCVENIFRTSERSFEANLVCFPAERQVTIQQLLPVWGVTDDWQLAAARWPGGLPSF